MTTPASSSAEEFLRRIFPEAPPAERSGTPHADEHEAPRASTVLGVDERRQQLLERIGEPDRESW